MDNAFKWDGAGYSSVNGIQTSVGERLIESIPLLPDMSVLDAGCGNGDITFLLANKVPHGHVTAVDLSESMIRQAEKSLKAQGLRNIEFHVCGVNELEYENKFDLVFSNSVLHWVPEIEDCIRRFYRALKHGGLLRVQFPLLSAEHPFVSYAQRAIRELGLTERVSDWTFPWYVPAGSEQFVRLLKDSGFADAEAAPEARLFPFPSADAIYRQFSSVGLSLFAAPLGEGEKSAFFERVLSDLKEDFPSGARLPYARLFAKAVKP
ncbi:MAG: methyltransferase domain-containing protein [Synergistes sp.]|nr:methyltransferase domain-containing protein [Synergistes sp.]